MPGFKLTTDGLSAQYEPIVFTVELTPEQQALLTRMTGQCASKLELTASELNLVLPHTIEWKEG